MESEIQDGLFGRLAVHRGFITLEQLTTATAEQQRRPGTERLRDVLVALGFVDEEACRSIDGACEEILRRRAEEEDARFNEPSVTLVAPVPTPVNAEVPDVKDVEAIVAGRVGSRAFSVSIDISEDDGPPVDPVVREASTRAREWLTEVLQGASRQGASDVHVHAGEPVRMRRFGTLWPVTDTALPPTLTELALRSLLDDKSAARLDEVGHVEGALSLPGVGRFRYNIYRQLWGTDGVFRVVRQRPPSLSTLGLPASLARLTTFRHGIVLVTGPAASGKTSTLAALVHMINEERAEHVITIEDPIEIVHSSLRCIVNQRQTKRDTASFSRALRAALREDPDVIVIGELRDRETTQLALTAAETGHLVLATLHTHSAVRTINRVIGEFPPAQQSNIRAMLAESLRAIVSQRLIPRRDNLGVAPAVEVMMTTPAVSNLIRESRVHQIRSAMQTGAALGMQTLDSSLQSLITNGVIDLEVARRYAEDPKALVGPPADTGDSHGEA